MAEGVRLIVIVPLLYPGAEAVSAPLPVLAKPCIEKPGTEKLPAVRGNVMDCVNGPAAVVASSKLGELLERVSVSLLGGAAPRLMDSLSTCRFCPRFVETLTLRFGALTVTEIELDSAPFGVVNPAGVAISKLAVPAATGWKLTVVVLVSAFMVTGLLTMVPAAVFELVTVTLTGKPVRSTWLACAVSVAGFS